ncbi:hypothetical protein [Vibrio crassostreae]|uniref:hypothetical protein n=1 Tax=Vibrio crassostreae TaxID=246167 RepID=UPI001B314679|nr:hypothetical protein [Vibrio crassostreae]
MRTLNCNKHTNKVHLYTYVEEAWNMVAQGHIEVTTASNQAICGGYKSIVTKDENKVTCTYCKKRIKETKET